MLASSSHISTSKLAIPESSNAAAIAASEPAVNVVAPAAVMLGNAPGSSTSTLQLLPSILRRGDTSSFFGACAGRAVENCSATCWPVQWPQPEPQQRHGSALPPGYGLPPG